MSFILDALNRSEAERKKGEPDESGAVPNATGTAFRRRSSWALGLGLLLMVGGAVAGWMIWGDALAHKVRQVMSDEPPAAPEVSTNTANEPPVAEKVAKRPAGNNQAQRPPPQKPLTAAERKAARIAERKKKFKEMRREKRQAEKNNSVAEPAATAVLDPPSAQTSDGGELKAVVDTAEVPKVPTGKTVSIGAPPPASTSMRADRPVLNERSEPAEPVAPKYKLVHELPLAVRVDMPEIQVNMHVYHGDPEKRFVMINMQRYHIGETLPEVDIQVSGIEPEGVVLTYQGHQFLLPNG